jgi:hypothetical protein
LARADDAASTCNPKSAIGYGHSSTFSQPDARQTCVGVDRAIRADTACQVRDRIDGVLLLEIDGFGALAMNPECPLL